MPKKGILNLYKPSGISSAQAVGKVKKILNTRAVGHMGTLDPMAEGVLLIGVGKATRLFNFLLEKDKDYVARFKFGYETDTLDAEGKTIKTSQKIPTAEEIQAVLPSFLGKTMQLPPDYSAKSINGVRAYDLARQGKAVELKPVPISIHKIDLINNTQIDIQNSNTQIDIQNSNTQIDIQNSNTDHEPSTTNHNSSIQNFTQPPNNIDEFDFFIRCSSGTYIRSICRDLAQKVGSCATMTALKRTRCGKYSLANSTTFDTLTNMGESEIIDLNIALNELKRLDIPTNFKKALDNGQKFCFNDSIEGENFAVFCDDTLYGIGTADKDKFVKITTYLKD